ncbi:MAG: ParA family protein [Rickettsiales bacterium]|jgi:chromosome partitioning protein|nr:ParA family protein [Rickettsiales bacterium]
MAKIIAFANQKGGVGKTTTALNVGASLAAVNKSVLLIDLDPQGNAGTGLGFVRSSFSRSIYRVIMGSSMASENILTTSVKGMHIIPSTQQLSGAEVELLDMDRRETRLKMALFEVRANYDYVLIDCPPAMGFLTVNALVAADFLIVPLQCEFLALEGLSQMMNSTEIIRDKWNQKLELMGILLTMYDRRNNLSKAIEDDVRKNYGDKVFQTIIPRNVRASEAPSHGKPILFYDFNSITAQAYLKLATEVVDRT